MTRAARHHSDAFLCVATALAVGWSLFGDGGVGAGATLVLAGAVLVLGLPHGALDLWVAARSGRFGRDGFSPGGFARFHLAYLAVAGLVVGAFVVSPVAALVGFLLLSLWHFADDWRGLPRPVALGCAGLVVAVPALAHPGEVAGVFAAVTGTAVAIPAALALVGAGLAGLCAAGAFVLDRRAGLEAGGVALLALVLPPLAFFAAYFTLLHAPRHVIRHADVLTGARARPVLALYTLAAIAIVAGLWLALGGGSLAVTEGTLRALFVGLAALSVPHAVLIEDEKRGGASRGAPAPSRASPPSLALSPAE